MILKVGFIGFGKSANRYHLPYVLLRDRLEVKMIYSRTRKRDLESKYLDSGIVFTDKLDEILHDPDIQLVSICTSHASHFELAKLCLENKKHVLVEKPFTTTLEEARELIHLADKNQLILMPFQNRRFDSDFLALKKVIQHKGAGEIVEIESHFDYFRPDFQEHKGKSYDGDFFGLGVHTIDQLVSLFGRPEKVYYDIRSIRNPNNPDDYYHVELFYKGFKAIVKTSHLVETPYPTFILHGTKGSFVKYGIDKQEECLKAGMSPDEPGFGLDPEENFGVLSIAESVEEEVIPTPKGDYGRIYDELYETIIHGKNKLVSNEEILTVLEILEKGIQGENPKVVTL
ncbi:oxidoreductase [Peribacillus kribbensis]|uniref:oxidoreductase n=1 Tax=Peribacillus kribbensis TaxID=356658 RepID=UPI00041E9A91|nr:oxidoreductase [Peribacillus kribbensis]